MPIRPHISKFIAGIPFFLGAWIFGFINDRWDVAIVQVTKKFELPGPTELYRDYLCDPWLPLAFVALLWAMPISLRSRTAIFISYLIVASISMALPYVQMGMVVSEELMTAKLMLPNILLGIAGSIIAVRIFVHFRKQKKNTES